MEATLTKMLLRAAGERRPPRHPHAEWMPGRGRGRGHPPLPPAPARTRTRTPDPNRPRGVPGLGLLVVLVAGGPIGLPALLHGAAGQPPLHAEVVVAAGAEEEGADPGLDHRQGKEEVVEAAGTHGHRRHAEGHLLEQELTVAVDGMQFSVVVGCFVARVVPFGKWSFCRLEGCTRSDPIFS